MLPFEALHMKLSDFNGDYTFPSMREVREYVELRYSQGNSINAIVGDLGRGKFNFDTRGFNWAEIVLAILRSKAEGMSGGFEDVYLYNKELFSLQSIENENARKIMYLALIVMKWNNHPSGWVRYEREDFFKFWGLQDLKNFEKEATMRICTKSGLELRVIGSKQPIICYHISFLQSSGDVMAMYRSEDDIKQWWEWLVKS